LEFFRDKALRIGKEKNSRIILALDLYAERKDEKELVRVKISRILNDLKDYIAGVKIGLPTLLTLGLENVGRIISEYRDELFFIADMKIADIDYVSKVLVKKASETGFDAVISHAIIGQWVLKEIVDEARKNNVGILTVCAMSYRGANESINTLFRNNLEFSLKVGVDGFILPATMPKYIREARAKTKKHLIASPGVGVQGAKPGIAIEAGADFEIIGRSIYLASDPVKAARNYVERLRWV